MTSQQRISGMTLLEILLSLAILGGSVAVISEMVHTSFQNARLARDLIQAELLAESTLAKVRLGIIDMVPAFNVPFSAYTDRSDVIMDTHAISVGNVGEVLWFYSLEIVEIDDYLIEIAVTVRQNTPDERRAAVCRLVRWFAYEPEDEEEEY